MIAVFFATVLAFSGTGAAPTTSATAAPQPAGPLREIVYKFSYDKYVSRQYEDYGIPPSVDQRSRGYSGTLTIDVTAVGGDGSIRLTATEASLNAENLKTPMAADIVVHPDGGLAVAGGKYDDIMMTLVPYFATGYFADRVFSQGATWQQDSTDNNTTYTTKFDITNVDADTATITSTTQPKQGKVSGTYVIETKLVYKPSLLVPISLNMVILSTGNITDSTASAHTQYSFQRVSDTRDQGSSGK